jgi:hypothetical protein
VAELQLVVQALKARVPGIPRPLRPVERKDGTEKRPGPPRMALPPRAGPDGPHPMQPNPMQSDPMQPSPELPSVGLPPMDREAPERKPGPEWLRRAMAEIESSPDSTLAGPEHFRGDDRRPLPDDWPPPVNQPLAPPTFPQATAQAAPEPAPPEPRPPPVTAQNIFDKVWPSERRKVPEAAPEKRAEAIVPPRAPEPWPIPAAPAPPPRAVESRLAPAAPFPPPPPAPPRVEQRPPSILKSGVIDEMAYTLFTDGSIEAQMPDGTMRFASIDALRDHLEKHED